MSQSGRRPPHHFSPAKDRGASNMHGPFVTTKIIYNDASLMSDQEPRRPIHLPVKELSFRLCHPNHIRRINGVNPV
jgi:hypothetical protein